MTDHGDNWDEYLDPVLFGIRTSVQESTKFTPFYLMYGREARFPLEVEKSPTCSDLNQLPGVDEVVSRLTSVRETSFPAAEQNIIASQKRQKEQHKRRKNVHKASFKVGDLVLRMNMKQRTRKGCKLEDRWLGPYRVSEVTPYGCCKLVCHKTGVALKTKVNGCQLKLFRHPSNLTASIAKARESQQEGTPEQQSILTEGDQEQSITASLSNEDLDLLREEKEKKLEELAAQHWKEKTASGEEYSGPSKEDIMFGRLEDERILQQNKKISGLVPLGGDEDKVRCHVNRY